MTGSGQVAKPVSPTPAYDVDVFLLHAKWLSEYHRTRGRDVQSRGVSLLGFTGVLVGLLPALLIPMRTLHGEPRHAARALLAAVSLALLSSAVCALQTLRARKGPSTQLEDVQRLWLKTLSGEPEHDAATAFTEWLLHGNSTDPSPVQEESNEAYRASKDFTGAACRWATACSRAACPGRLALRSVQAGAAGATMAAGSTGAGSSTGVAAAGAGGTPVVVGGDVGAGSAGSAGVGAAREGTSTSTDTACLGTATGTSGAVLNAAVAVSTASRCASSSTIAWPVLTSQ